METQYQDGVNLISRERFLWNLQIWYNEFLCDRCFVKKKNEYRAVENLLYLEGIATTSVKAELATVNGVSALSFVTVEKRQLKHSRTESIDDEHSE